MLNKRLTFLFALFFLFLILPNVSSAPTTPFITSSSSGLYIETPPLHNAKLGIDQRFHAHVVNDTKILTNSTVTCFLHFYNQSGWDATTVPQVMPFESYNGIDFATTVKAGNFSTVGQYAYVITCNSSLQAGFLAGQLDVTPNGMEATEGDAIINIGLLAMLVIFLIGSIFLFVNYNGNLLATVGLGGLSYLLLMATSFVSWNMAENYLLSAPFIAEMFRILFFVLIVGFFPLIIGAFAWYFYMLFKIKEIERLMGKGFSEDEARRRVR